MMNKKYVSDQQSVYALSAGFLIIIILFFSVTVIGISHIKSLSNSLTNVVTKYSLRTHLAHTMRNVSRERSMLLLAMTQTKDAFDRDDIYMKMSVQADKYLVAREKMFKTDLSSEEFEAFEQQHQQTIKAVIQQKKVLRLLEEDQFLASQKLLLEHAIPVQNESLALLDKYIDWQQKNSSKVLDDASSKFDLALRNIIVFTIAGILLSIFIAYYVIRKVNLTIGDQIKAEKELVVLNDNLEMRIEERTSELKEVNEKLQHLASYDATTELPNRIFFNDVAERILSTSVRYDFLVAVFFLDLDGFKNINDSYGHDVGDALLWEVAQKIQKILRKGDVIARIGGDEFTIILGHVQNKENIKNIAQKIIDSVGEAIDIMGNNCQIGVSIGISTYPENGDNIEALIKAADNAMYITKKSGKNNYSFA